MVYGTMLSSPPNKVLKKRTPFREAQEKATQGVAYELLFIIYFLLPQSVISFCLMVCILLRKMRMM